MRLPSSETSQPYEIGQYLLSIISWVRCFASARSEGPLYNTPLAAYFFAHPDDFFCRVILFAKQ
jgi:hypothetical protein